MLRTLAIMGALLTPLAAQAADVVRHPIPDSDFPILQAVEVPAGKTVVYLSGTVPGVADAEADPASAAAWGDMQTQTVSVLNTIDAQLRDMGMGMGDVIKMQAFLVAPEDGPVDFSGFMAGYTQFFGTEDQPNLPVRSAMVVDALVHPQWLVEIEVTAVRAVDACRPEDAEKLVGEVNPGDAVILAVSGASVLRQLGPDQPMTMDYRFDRVTVVKDQDSGRVLRATCG